MGLYCFFLLSLLIFSISVSAARFSCSYCFCLLSLLSFSISVCAARFSCSYLIFFALNCGDCVYLSSSNSFCLLSLISCSISVSAARFCLIHSLTCSFLCSAVLGVLCKNGNFFLMSSIKSLGNFLILLLKDFNFIFSSSVLNFGVLSSITFFS